ncbi:MAG: hypothetical protein KDE31_04705, partial [Caldilineaceae bacterium]|nr:hypothetical protein [Caldilineaceae bacterium]
GRSNAYAIRNAIRVAKQGIEHDILGQIQQAMVMNQAVALENVE